MAEDFDLGQRIAWYRRRRGMTQEVLAGRVRRSVDWVSKVENGRMQLDRLSVLREVADALGVTLGRLLDETSVQEQEAEQRRDPAAPVREALLSFDQVTPLLAPPLDETPTLERLNHRVRAVWDAYQSSRYRYVIQCLPALLTEAHFAVQIHDGDDHLRACALFGLAHQAAAMILTKLGDGDLALIAADRGLSVAQRSGDPLVIGSLYRSVVHSLLATGRFAAAVRLTDDAAGILQAELGNASHELLSIYGTLFLTGSMAAARAHDGATARGYLAEAEKSAHRLGRDANHMGTAFGPTNVRIHRVSTAMELGDLQIAVDLGPRVDTSPLPIERRVRHALEVAHAYTQWNRPDEALALVLDAERLAPEQVRYHFLARKLYQTWMRQQHGKPSFHLAELGRRLGMA